MWRRATSPVLVARKLASVRQATGCLANSAIKHKKALNLDQKLSDPIKDEVGQKLAVPVDQLGEGIYPFSSGEATLSGFLMSLIACEFTLLSAGLYGRHVASELFCRLKGMPPSRYRGSSRLLSSRLFRELKTLQHSS